MCQPRLSSRRGRHERGALPCDQVCGITLLLSKMMRTQDVRSALGDQLGTAVTDSMWTYLVRMGFVGEVVDERRNIEYLANEVRQLREAAGGSDESPKMAGQRRPATVSQTNWALSQLVAKLANADEDVERFRDEVLGGDLLQWSELEAWVAGEAKVAGPPTVYLTVPLPAATDLNRNAQGRLTLSRSLRSFSQYRVQTEVLKYAGPDDEWIRLVPITAGSVLDRLRRLADGLAGAFGWQAGQATIFVLTAITPLIAPIQVRTQTAPVHAGNWHPWARRVTLEVDPAVPVELVARSYRSARASIGLGRSRTLSEKHAALAAFCADRESEGWPSRFTEWNRRHPKWRYLHKSNFRRDAIRAEHRLLAPAEYPGSTPVRKPVGRTEP